jgi:hypothetical protein
MRKEPNKVTDQPIELGDDMCVPLTLTPFLFTIQNELCTAALQSAPVIMEFSQGRGRSVLFIPSIFETGLKNSAPIAPYAALHCTII